MGLVAKDDGWRMPDELWAQIEPLLPPRPEHPLGCHNPRVPDRARETIESIPIKRPRPTRNQTQGLCLDKGYDYSEVDALVDEFGFTGHIARRGQDAKRIKRTARRRAHRWVVERTHSWMNRFRRILVRWEKRADTYVAMLHLACALITWRAGGLLGYWDRL